MQTIMIHFEIPFTRLMWNRHYTFTLKLQDITRDNLLSYMTAELHFKIMILWQLCNGILLMFLQYT